MTRRGLWAALLVTGLLAALSAHAGQEGLAYGPDPAQRLDVCTPTESHGAAPAVVLFHGGGWRIGSRDQQTHVCELFSRAGVVAFPADYRLADGTPQTTWPAQLNDAQLVMRWVRAHAAEYGIDPSHICAYGTSSGGHLALLLGVLPTIAGGDMQALLPDVSPQANCVVSIAGPTDLVTLADAKPGLVTPLFLGGDAGRRRALERDASPALRVQRGAAPTLLVHGSADPAVPFAQAETMVAALTRAGVPVWLFDHRGRHGLVGVPPTEHRDFDALSIRFVKSLGLGGIPRRTSLAGAAEKAR